MENNKIYFAKLRKGATIPSKRDCDMGYDVYACFDEDCIMIPPHTTKMIPTGLISACSEEYGIILKERGSTGTKGIAQRCGVIEGSYRNEWFVPITNTTNKNLIIAKDVNGWSDDCIVYPYEKAICQFIVVPIPKMNIEELTPQEILNIESERGTGCLGSSGK